MNIWDKIKTNTLVPVVMVLSLVVACESNNFVDLPDEKITNITRIFWNQRDLYTIFIKSDEEKEVTIKSIYTGSYNFESKVRIFVDVPPNEKVWIYQKRVASRYAMTHPFATYLEIHLHDVQEIHSGTYRTQGKFPQEFKIIELE